MVLEPTTIAVDMSMTGPSGNMALNVSNIRLNLSPDILELAMSLQTSVLEPLIQPPAEQPVSKCTTFIKVGICVCRGGQLLTGMSNGPATFQAAGLLQCFARHISDFSIARLIIRSSLFKELKSRALVYTKLPIEKSS